jgi:hypothetical protein
MRPILVTGAHRSGTTWVGRTICYHPETIYVHEPFNLNRHHPQNPFTRWYEAVDESTAPQVMEYIRESLLQRHSRFRDFRRRLHLYRWRDVSRRHRIYRGVRAGLWRPVMKDPLALLSSEWLHETFGMDVIIVIRHPAAFASSVLRFGWEHPFEDFQSQPHLMKGLLARFRREIAEYARVRHPPLDQMILLWRILHHAIRRYQAEHPDWLFVRHKDLSVRPRSAFEQVFKHVGLSYGDDIRRRIRDDTKPENTNHEKGVFDTKRSSAENIWIWKDRLSREEQDRIREGTVDIAQHFYDDEDW